MVRTTNTINDLTGNTINDLTGLRALRPGRREQAIREWAYAIWEEEGCPDGKDLDHWLRAEAKAPWLSPMSEAELAWLEFADKLRQIGFSIIHQAQITLTSKWAKDPKIIAILLLIRTISNLRGTVILIHEGIFVEARILAHSCFDNFFWIAQCLVEGDDFIEKILEDDRKRIKSSREFLLKGKSKISDIVGSKLPVPLRVTNKNPSHPKFHNRKDIVKQIVQDACIFYSELSEDAAHPSVRSLGRYLTRPEGGCRTVIAVNCEPDPRESEIIDTLASVCIAVIVACAGVNDILGGTLAGQQLGRIADEYKALLVATRHTDGADGNNG